MRFEGRRRSNKGDHGKLGRFLFETGYSFCTSHTAVISSLNKVSGRMMHFVFNWSRSDRKVELTVTRFSSEAIYIYTGCSVKVRKISGCQHFVMCATSMPTA